MATHGQTRYGDEPAVQTGWQGIMQPYVHVPPETFIVYQGQAAPQEWQGHQQWQLEEQLEREYQFADETIRGHR
jgi:hypothetical protein